MKITDRYDSLIKYYCMKYKLGTDWIWVKMLIRRITMMQFGKNNPEFEIEQECSRFSAALRGMPTGYKTHAERVKCSLYYYVNSETPDIQYSTWNELKKKHTGFEAECGVAVDHVIDWYYNYRRNNPVK